MTESIEAEKIVTAAIRCEEIMAEHGLDNWRLRLNNNTSTLATTYHDKKIISFSKKFLIIAKKDQLEGIALHEITHALLGPGYGHGTKFVEMCNKISPNSDYARSTTSIHIRKYILTCPVCGQEGSHNFDNKRYCGICWKKGDKVEFNIRKNVLKIEPW